MLYAMMGKTQRFSEGHSLGFVPEYRHAVETVGESEGFGSSGRVDSEDSSGSKRKCISLNMNRRSTYNVPSQVLSVSQMSKYQRKEAEMRLRGELQQVQFLQKKLISKNATSVSKAALSSSSVVPLKKHNTMAHNGPNSKLSNSGKYESVKQVPQPLPVASNKQSNHAFLMKQCGTILNQLLAHKFAWVFKEPVDIVKLNIPDYFQVIQHPMDLGTVRSKLNSGSYSNPWSFASDVRLTFTNAMTYNPPSNDVHFMADSLSKMFESRWKHIEKKLVSADATAKRQTENLKSVPQLKKRKASPVYQETIVQQESTKPKMTEEEKLNLGRRLESFSDMPDIFVDFFRIHTNNLNQTTEDEIEIDIDSLSDDTLFKLKKLVDDYSRGRQSVHQANAEPCEVDILNESGLSNSSMHAGKGTEQVDEDVDIGGNDPPVSSYPPVVIDKDAMLRSDKHSNSSSSSSDSGSSSSDSDSSSSSGSESDVKVSPQKNNKESLPSGTALDDEKNEISSRIKQNNALDQLEHNADTIPESVDADHSKEGENTPSERQVSPEKLYRAALLRSRFADTILKAREKTLDQVDKKDPEKLRQEREELERLQREEKARLQAEAKAAEDARKRAEAVAAAQAAAEAKRQRELEREAARQALLQMEKTVEINENGRFLEDLEMFRTAPGEQLPSSVGETSPAHSQEGIGGFNLGGSNPLEQLGLYMKVDDDEEEEVERTVDPINDAEEGEID